MGTFRMRIFERYVWIICLTLLVGGPVSSAKAEGRLPEYRELFADAPTLIGELRVEPGAVFLKFARASMNKGLWADALAYAKRTLELNGQDLEAQIIRGEAAALLGDMAGTLRTLQVLKERKANDGRMHLLEAVLQRYEGKPEKARKTLEAALKDQRDHLPFRYLSGALFLAAKEFDEAEKEFKWILNHQPAFVPALAGMGQVSLAREERKTAARFFARALEHDPENRLYHQRLLEIYRHDGETEKTRMAIQQLNFHSPEVKGTLLRKGRHLLNHGAFREAAEEMDRFFGIYRKSMEGHFIRAAAFANLGRYKDAHQDLGAFLLGAWGLPEAHHDAGLCFLAMEDVESAADQFKEAISRSPVLSESFLPLLVIEQMRGNYQDALEGMALIQDGEASPLVQYLMAQTFLARGDWNRYGEKMSLAVGLIPGLACNMVFPAPPNEFWRSVARDRSLLVLYFRNAWYGKALEASARLAEACPEDVFVGYITALCQEMLYRPGEARESFLKLLRIRPDLAEGYLGLGRMALKTGALDEAEAAFRKALIQDPDHAPNHVFFGDLQIRRGQTQAAVKSFRLAIGLAPLNAQAYPRLARILAESTDTLQEAAVLARKAYEMDPSEPLAQDAVGWIMVLNGDTEEGLEKIISAQIEHPDDPAVLYHMGYAYFLKGELRSARRSLERALALSENFPGSERARDIVEKIPDPD